jgi:OOP family OmpA-OmpF porin
VLVPELNSRFRDTRMAIRSDGLEMILTSNRPGGIGPARLNLNPWASTRASTLDQWSTLVNPGRPINSGSGFVDRGPALSFDGETLCFASNRPGGFGGRDLYMGHTVQIGAR